VIVAARVGAASSAKSAVAAAKHLDFATRINLPFITLDSCLVAECARQIGRGEASRGVRAPDRILRLFSKGVAMARSVCELAWRASVRRRHENHRCDCAFIEATAGRR
jgi:hypothetical protein